jgi:hypothetical protein
MTGGKRIDPRRFWRDADDRVVIVQFPNIPLTGWLVFAVLGRLADSSGWKDGASHTSSAFLFAWAYLELAQGVNYFRRLLGLGVLAAAVVGYF